MTITNPDDVGLSLAHDATDAARQDLSALSLGAVAPESYPGKLRSQDRLIDIVNAAFERAPAEAATIAGSVRADIDALRRSELKADPFATACLGGASRSVQALPGPLGSADIRAVITGLIGTTLTEACRDVDHDTTRRLKTRKGPERRRRRLKAEIDTFAHKVLPVLAGHIAGLVRDELADELVRRHEASLRAQDALRRFCAEANDPGEDIPGFHRFSCGPRVEVVLRAAAVRRPDLLDRDGQPTEVIWPAFGADVASGELTVMEDPQQAIDGLRRFLERTVAEALDGLTLDGLYAMTQQQPEVTSWITSATARLQVADGAPHPYRVQLAQVPAGTSNVLYDQVLQHIQTATRSEEPNRLQLVELTYAFTSHEVLGADPRGIDRVLADVQRHASNPKLAEALKDRRNQFASPGASRDSAADRARDNGGSTHDVTTAVR